MRAPQTSWSTVSDPLDSPPARGSCAMVSSAEQKRLLLILPHRLRLPGGLPSEHPYDPFNRELHDWVSET